MITQMQDAYLQPNNVLVDLEYIFVEPRGGKLRFVYLPILDYANKTDFLVLFRGLVKSVSLMGDTDQRGVQKLRDYLDRTVMFSIHDLERFIRNSMNPPEENPWEAAVANAMKSGRAVRVCRCCKATNAGDARYCDSCGRILDEKTTNGFMLQVSWKLADQCGNVNKNRSGWNLAGGSRCSNTRRFHKDCKQTVRTR